MWKTLIPVCMNVATNVLYIAALAVGWKLAKAVGMNQGVISTLLSLASLFNICIFYCKFGEKISALHFIGVFLMIACIVCISLEAAGKEDDDVDLEESLDDGDDTFGLSKSMAGILAICCGLTGALLMSTKHLFIRMYKSNYSGIDMGFDSAILEWTLFLVLLIPLSQTDFTFGWKEIAIGSIAGILITCGRICIAIAVSVGLAGPA